MQSSGDPEAGTQETETAAGVREGEILAGKYRVERVLGVGGMGVVIAAHHLQLDELVALKFLRTEVLCIPEAVARFAREARAAVKIKSEHVARVTDVGTLETGAPYMVMEYLEGSDLAAWLREKGPLPVEQAVDFVLQACEAIAEAHTVGIVHRDLKPGNLFVIRRPHGTLSVKVLDFGISKRVDLASTNAEMTQTSEVMGSPLYMSPEQLRSSRDVDARADIWSLGIILHQLIAGQPPFKGNSMAELVFQIVSSPPQPLIESRPEVPVRLHDVIQKCLHKDREDRYETVGDLAVALMPFGSARARDSVERISGVMQKVLLTDTASPQLSAPPKEKEALEMRASGTTATWAQTRSTGLRRRPLVGLAAGLVVLMVAGGIWLVLRAPLETGASLEPDAASDARLIGSSASAPENVSSRSEKSVSGSPAMGLDAGAPVVSAVEKKEPIAAEEPVPGEIEPSKPPPGSQKTERARAVKPVPKRAAPSGRRAAPSRPKANKQAPTSSNPLRALGSLIDERE